ncbi:MAG TPA: anti-sigma factor [Solirubrobacteraceae bacterium]|nr:anti-sigma factor [Solirubrobacteraceae bacterium]
MSPIDTLPADQRAVVRLVLRQSRSYAEIAETLGMDDEAVRGRAHAALAALGPDVGPRLTPGRRGELADYLLGQQSVSGREATRALLDSSASARAWARVVASELEPLARGATPTAIGVLPEIPEEGDDEAPGKRHARTALRDAATAAPTSPAGARSANGRSRRGGYIVLAGLAVVIGVVIFLIVDSGGKKKTSHAGRSRTSTQPTQPRPQVLGQINLRSAQKSSRAVGIAQILSSNGKPALAIVAQNLQPNGNTSAYEVWLYNSRKDARALGYVNPPVGKDGKFQNVQPLTGKFTGFKELIVTRETRQNKLPGAIVLRGPIKLARGG